MQSHLSIVMPVFNEKHLIEKTVEDVLHRLSPADELIVVDGGSTDGTWDVLQGVSAAMDNSTQHAQLKLAQGRKGRAGQMNAGARLATNDILLFLHADTHFLPNSLPALNAVVSTLKPGVRFWGRFDVRIQGQSWLLPVIAWFMNQRSRLTRVATGDQAIFVTRSLFHRIGGYFDQPLMEDIELCKTLNTQPDAFFLPLDSAVITSGRRWDERGALATIWLMWTFRFRYWRGASAYDLARKYRDVRLTEEAVDAVNSKLAGLGGSSPSGVEAPFEKTER